MNSDRWQFWLDVGGTFTDCLARRPDGTLLKAKVLSSALVKGRVAAGSTAPVVCDAARAADPEDFWAGYTLRILDNAGRIVEQQLVKSFASGRLSLAGALARLPAVGSAYEVASPEDAPILAIRQFLALRLDQPIPPCVVRLGTTKGTNALLTRRGARWRS